MGSKQMLSGSPDMVGMKLNKLAMAVERINGGERYPGWKQVIVDKKMTIEQVPVEVAKVKAKYGRVDLIVLDHIEKYIPGKEEKKTEMSRVSAFMAQHSKDTGIPNILVAQMNRSIESATKKRDEEEKRNPRMSDLAECGDLEKDATQIYFCDERGLFCAKARFGEKDVWLPCFFSGEYLRWIGKGGH